MQLELSPPTIIDIEASGFGSGSYPIEIGFVTTEGERYCSLIRPLDHWTHWDEQAAAVHGIRRDLLLEKGKPVTEVAHELNRRLAGRTVYSDAWSYDYTWLAVLFEEAGFSSAFRLEHIYSLLHEAEVQAWPAVLASVERELALPRHRASSDALILQQTWLRVSRAIGFDS
jgi:DNA polymerase III epsilon subunit-like protein